jgi:hypothetical protein
VCRENLLPLRRLNISLGPLSPRLLPLCIIRMFVHTSKPSSGHSRLSDIFPKALDKFPTSRDRQPPGPKPPRLWFELIHLTARLVHPPLISAQSHTQFICFLQSSSEDNLHRWRPTRWIALSLFTGHLPFPPLLHPPLPHDGLPSSLPCKRWWLIVPGSLVNPISQSHSRCSFVSDTSPSPMTVGWRIYPHLSHPTQTRGGGQHVNVPCGLTSTILSTSHSAPDRTVDNLFTTDFVALTISSQHQPHLRGKSQMVATCVSKISIDASGSTMTTSTRQLVYRRGTRKRRRRWVSSSPPAGMSLQCSSFPRAPHRHLLGTHLQTS